MRFKIVTVGWNCAQFIEQTLASVQRQKFVDWDIFIIDDATPDPNQACIIDKWCEDRWLEGDTRWRYLINDFQEYATQNQRKAIRWLLPDDEDVIVFLDLDGDQLATKYTLQELYDTYQEPDVMMTYGQYTPIPDLGTSSPAIPWPSETVKNNSYRREVLRSGPHFNHLRTMKAKLAKAIPDDQFCFTRTGIPYLHGCDYIFMISGLELSGGRYKCMDKVTCLYNHANPMADNKQHPEQSSECVVDFLHKRPLQELEY